MRQHSHQLGVQMAATACLYNLSKGEQAAKIHPSCLQQVVASTLEAMRNYPSHQQVFPRMLVGLMMSSNAFFDGSLSQFFVFLI